MPMPRPIGPSLPGEVWIPVRGFEEYYEVSNMGRLRTTPRVLGEENAGGYLCANMMGKFMGYGQSRGRKREQGTFRVPIHRVVAMTFLGKPTSAQTQINHKDGDKLNNRADNLEFCTPSQNIQHGYDTGLIPKHNTHRLTVQQYREIRALYATGDWTHERLAVKYGCSSTNIGYVLHRSKRKV